MTNKDSAAETMTPREIALRVHIAAMSGSAWSNKLLPEMLRQHGISGSEAAFATELCYGSLRLQGRYDPIIEQVAGRSEMDLEVMAILRLAAHQHFALSTSSYALVDESVKLSKIYAPRASGLINAVLRKLVALDRIPPASGSSLAEIAREHSHPLWVAAAFEDTLRRQGLPRQLAAALEANNSAPRVNYAAIAGRDQLLDKARKLFSQVDFRPSHLSPLSFSSEGIDPKALLQEFSPYLRVQDEGSQLAALALLEARPLADQESWLDMCAGPGGKTALLAERLPESARLLAVEINPTRARQTEDATVFSSRTRVVCDDASALSGQSFDRILLDAPCSGLGSLRRRPELRWVKDPREIEALLRLQKRLFTKAASLLKPAGVLAYVTCSPHLPETIQQVAGYRRLGLERLSAPQIVSAFAPLPAECALEGDYLQLWPHLTQTDAMFISLFTRSQ